MRLLFLATGSLFSLVTLAQVTYMPEVEKQDQNFIWIKSVEIGEIYTKISFYFQPPGEAWICLDQSYYLVASGTENKKFMMAAENIPFCPKTKKVGSLKEYLDFEVLFPSIDKGIEKIDLIENIRNGINFYGVIINNGGRPALSDSLNLKNEQAFVDYFQHAAPSPDSLEGVWKVDLNASHYGPYKLIDNHFRKDRFTVALLRNGKSYKVYKTDGAFYEMVLTPAAGGRTIFFRKYFREVDQEVTGYIKNFKPRFFEMEIELPGRLGHYELLPNYRPGDRIKEVYKFYKKFPLSPDLKNR